MGLETQESHYKCNDVKETMEVQKKQTSDVTGVRREPESSPMLWEQGAILKELTHATGNDTKSSACGDSKANPWTEWLPLQRGQSLFSHGLSIFTTRPTRITESDLL